jgi:hypothetical protein
MTTATRKMPRRAARLYVKYIATARIPAPPSASIRMAIGRIGRGQRRSGDGERADHEAARRSETR